MGTKLSQRLRTPVDGASVAVVRIVVGLLVAVEAIGYLVTDELRIAFVEPDFHFTYYLFDWVSPWPEPWLQLHFAALAAAALLVAAGALYRLAAPLMLVGFAYLFLLEETEYLNHFYAVVLLALLLAVIPADSAISVRSLRRGFARPIPAWSVWVLRFQVGVLYFYGGIAKLNSDWLHGEPMGIWLAAREDLALVGPLLAEPATAYAFAWGGAALDLLIVPALLWRRTRALAFAAAVAFHLTNAVVWDIGIFPWLMIAATTVFFAPDWPRRLAAAWHRMRPGPLPRSPAEGREAARPAGGLPAPISGGSAAAPRATALQRAGFALLGLYVAVQLLVPLRHHLYPGDVGWTEEGHRFAWHMKLRDKHGEARFFAFDPADGRRWELELSGLITQRQRSRMASHPDMLLQLAHHLAERERARGREVEIQVEALVSLNGRPRQFLVDPDRDLSSEPRDLRASDWILPQRLPLD